MKKFLLVLLLSLAVVFTGAFAIGVRVDYTISIPATAEEVKEEPEVVEGVNEEPGEGVSELPGEGSVEQPGEGVNEDPAPVVEIPGEDPVIVEEPEVVDEPTTEEVAISALVYKYLGLTDFVANGPWKHILEVGSVILTIFFAILLGRVSAKKFAKKIKKSAKQSRRDSYMRKHHKEEAVVANKPKINF